MSTRPPADGASIAISGIGLVTSLGTSLSESFENLCAGRSGIRLPNDSHHEYGSMPGAGFPVDPALLRIDPLWDDPVFSILDQTLAEALAQARLDPRSIDPARIAVVVGLSKGAVRLKSRWAANADAMAEHPLARRFGLAGVAPSSGAAFVASRIGSTGPAIAPIAACATGLTCVRVAADLVAQGTCDIAIAGSADASLIPMMEAAFRRMKALATPHSADEPATGWIRPWSATRNGFLIGEGGALFVLERESALESSGRRALARLTRFASGSEAHHATRPHGSAEVLSRVLRETAGQERIMPDAIHLHATATRDFDALEASAIRQAYGDRLGHSFALASKAQIGHCLGAAGALELAIACASLCQGVLPPFAPRPPFDFVHPIRPVGPEPIARKIDSIVKIVAGFGGHIEACLLTTPETHPPVC